MPRIATISFILLSFGVSLHAETATQIIRYGEKQLRGNTSQAFMTMTIKRAEFTRQLKIRSWAVGQKKALVEILDPPKEEGIASLRVDDQMWNYLPNTDQVVRVPTSLMLQPWMGSDFTNDDLMKASSLARDYRHRLVKKQKVNGQVAWLIRCVPKPNAPVVWGKVLYWARTKDKLPIKEAYYDEDGVLVRTLHFRRFQRRDNRIVPTLIIVEKADSPGETTRVSYHRLLFDRAIDPQIFQRERLKSFTKQGRELSQGWSQTLLARAPRGGTR